MLKKLLNIKSKLMGGNDITRDTKMTIARSTYNAIKRTVGSKPPETGGIIYGLRKDGIILKFVFDAEATVTGSTYTFNHRFINEMNKALWKQEGLQLIGFLHSHPDNHNHPSSPDMQYFASQFANIYVDKFLIPIIRSGYNACEFKIFPFIVYKDDPYNFHEV